jgi:NAD(P)-dependent dehydrogenase (short-subunit alcohol dehydrogenase family)
MGVALVTGGGGGVGRATAAALARSGYDVVVLGRSRDALEAVAAPLRAAGHRALAVTADVADRATVEAALRDAREVMEPITCVVNAAGVAESSPLLPPDDVLFDRTMATNVRGAWVVSTACLPAMLATGRGRIVNVASTAALQGFRFVAAYVASKHALLGLTRAMALDLKGRGVTVNALCPGVLDTPMTQRSIDRIAAATGRTREEALADLLASGEQSRLIPAEEVAEAVLRLLRPEADEVTGAAIGV